ncbi:MAG: ATP-binding protein [Dokdonella sp.]
MTDPKSFTCARHGEYSSVGDQGRARVVNCPPCVAENTAAENAWRRAWQIRSAWERSGLPHRFRDRTIENWKPVGKGQLGIRAAILAYVANLADAYESGRGLLLLGPVGVGKTHLAAGVLNLAIAAGFSGQFVRVGDLFATMKRSFAKGQPDFDDLPLRQANFVVLDDLGASRGSEWETAVLHDLLAHRYDERLPTIVTTNVPEFDRFVGDRVADRFDENSLRLTIAGTSHRKAVGIADEGSSEAIPEPPRTLSLTTCEWGRMLPQKLEYETGRKRLA